MQLISKIVVSFEMVFPNEEPKELHEYLKGISKKKLLMVSPFFLGFNTTNSEYSNVVSFLNMFFSSNNSELASSIYNNLLKFISEKGENTIEQYEIPYVISSLSFFEYVYDNDFDEVDTLSKEKEEENIFKAYILLNQQNTTGRNKILENTISNVNKELKPISFLISLYLNSFDLTNYDIRKVFSTQLLRAILFFEFLSEREDCSVLVSEFYKFYNIKNYSEYLKRILPFASAVILKDREAQSDIIIDNTNKTIDTEFLDKLIINSTIKIENSDFINIRSNPILKINKTTYRIISPLFVLEMIYNGLYWKFKEVNDGIREGRVDNLYNIKTYNFSEKYILHRVLKEIFGKRYIQKNGDELDGIYDGAPDYYVRNGKKVFLFESKDILINATVKQSSDFSIIEAELKKKLYINEKGKPKGLLQLINNIKKILKGQLEFDKGINPKNVIVFPILILHNRIFNTSGINKLINYWFNLELDILKEKGYDTSNIKSVVIIDIDTLLFNKDAFMDRKINLEKCIVDYDKKYLKFSLKDRTFISLNEVLQAQKNSYLPFSLYLDTTVERRFGRTIPRELKEKGFGIINKTKSIEN